MRYLILSDIHANLTALDTVMAALPRDTWDDLLVLGDLVGYGPDPGAVVDRIRELNPSAVVRGNHDRAAVGLISVEDFNPAAARAAQWTADQLSADQRDWLAALPQGPLAVSPTVLLCHGTPDDEDTYVFDELDAQAALSTVSRRVIFYGHTHQAAVYESTGGDSGITDLLPCPAPAHWSHVLAESRRYLINPGSVGQPRDKDARAGCGLYEAVTGELTLLRVDYDIADTQDRMRKAGLPASLINRLAMGC